MKRRQGIVGLIEKRLTVSEKLKNSLGGKSQRLTEVTSVQVKGGKMGDPVRERGRKK